MIYFCSDFHYSHVNICKGVSKWENKDTNCRNFSTIEQMNESIIKSINLIVKENDILYHLGDWSFAGFDNIWNFRKQINCKNIIQINGNHDHFIAKDKFFPYLEKQGDTIYEISDKKYYHNDCGVKSDNDVTAKDLFKSVHDMLKISINKQELILCHYPIEEWENMDRGSIMLHGHVHHDLDNCETNTIYRRMDVGWNGKVYSFDEIMDIMAKRKIKKHH